MVVEEIADVELEAGADVATEEGAAVLVAEHAVKADAVVAVDDGAVEADAGVGAGALRREAGLGGDATGDDGAEVATAETGGPALEDGVLKGVVGEEIGLVLAIAIRALEVETAAVEVGALGGD